MWLIPLLWKYVEHFSALFEQIAKLDEALYNIQFEQHWLEAQTDRQAICMFLVSYSLL
ncbi:Os09g0507600 [Oryza sativa Japonica Group]|uniref:Os09g0507600 protein n=1 Tax=Oryza sativa subsp. japonica TaxID=39947 RepID=Q0J0I4_ORYSJ|nr:Os09g0507600 [Oryza sativa Japonica Group]|eukprot:NP_001063617.2 Os09g0507600 [Oryza sativa Japonica Group]